MHWFRVWLAILAVLLVGAFVATASYWLWLTLTRPSVLAKGGIYYVFAAGLLALLAFFAYRALDRWVAGGES